MISTSRILGSIGCRIVDNWLKSHVGEDVPLDVDAGRDLDELHAPTLCVERRSAR